MNNPNDVVQNKHLDALAARIANFLGGDNVDDVVVAEDPNAIKISIGDFRFQFTGVIDGLTLHENNFYAADDSSHSTPLGSVTQSVVNGKTKFVFNLTSDAIDVADGQTGTVSCGKLTPNVDFDFTITPETYPGGWKASKTKGDYIYNSDELYGHAYDETTDETTGKISYTYSATQEDPQGFSIKLANDITLTAIESDKGIGDASDIDENKVELGEIVRDENGRITSISVTLKAGALPANGFDTDTTVAFEWDKIDGYGVTPTTKVTLDASYTDYITPINTPATFTENSGTYTFTARSTSAGYTPKDGKIYFTTKKGGDTFTITNLASGLWIDCNNVLGRYEIFSHKGFCVGSIEDKQSTDGKPVDANVTITNTAAIAGFNGDTAPTQTFQIILTDTDNGNSLVKYKLKFDESIIRPYGDDVPAKFLQDTSDLTKYNFTPPISVPHFTADKETLKSGAQATTSYTFTPAGNNLDFYTGSLVGISYNITDLALDMETKKVTATVDGTPNVEIASEFRSTALWLTPAAFPFDGCKISSDDFYLHPTTGMSITDYTNISTPSITGSNGEYFVDTGFTSSPHYVRNNLKWLIYREGRPPISFTVSGLRTDLGALAFDEIGNIHAKNGGIVGKMIRNQITWYQHALLIPSTTVTVQ